MSNDGSLVFDTGIDKSGFDKDLSKLTSTAAAAAATITAAFAAAAGAAVNVGASFEASMSQVAATMGITSLDSSYKLLSDAAKDMGAATKFSATQAGDALNYLALAGYDAEKAVSALPTVLNTAAAGGLDLAYASDLITDSMSALGLGMDELESFSDKLAKTSQKSNTNISQLGEAILTVGGTAKTLSGGVTELNTMLGLIADNGIKGAEGGTALRNIILSLSAPTDTAAAAMERLNISAFDSQGKMRDLSAVFSDFNTALAPLTDQEKTQALNEIFNKVDLKAVNALLGTSAERFEELTGYIEDCEGAAAQMADTMNDNLQGDITIMQSALEGLGVSAYEKFASPMRTAVQEITDIFGDLNSEINGELGDKLATLAEKFGDIAVNAAEFAADEGIPKLIDSLEWICDNSDQLFIAAKSAAAMVVAYKGLSAANAAATSVAAFSKAVSGAATASQALGIAMNAVPWVAVATLAIGGATALASYIDKQKELIGYEGEIKEAFNEANKEIAIQNNLLAEQAQSSSVSDRRQAYETAKEDMKTFTESIENNNARLTELYNKRQQINLERDNIHNTWSDPRQNNIMTELNKQLDEVEQEIAGINEQNIFLESALTERRHIIEEYSDFDVAPEHVMNQDIINRQNNNAQSVLDRYKREAAAAAASQEEINKALADAWEELDHKYATGVIKDEKELYSKRIELLAVYGDESQKEHWKYYEQIYSYEKKFNEESNEAEKERLDKNLEMQKDRYKKQLTITTDGINGLLSEYKKAMNELDSSISGYKSKLLTVGDVFSISETTDKNGSKVRQYTVENLKEQMEQMRKYHAYVKELKASGASQGLLEELTSLNFDDGAVFGKYLTDLSDSEFSQINELYKEREALADELSKDLYAGEAEQINNAMLSAVDSAVMQLPAQAQAAGRQFLSEFISGLDLSSEDISDEVSNFVSGFTELYNSSLEDMDLKSGFSIALDGINTYSMGQQLAKELTAGFNEEMARYSSEIKASQLNLGTGFTSSYKPDSAAVSAKKSSPEKIQLNANISTDVILDYEKVGKAVCKYITETERRRG